MIVPHDPPIARYVGRVVAIRDGKTSSETIRRTREPSAENGGDGDGREHGEGDHTFEELVMLDSAGRLQVPKEVRERYGIGDRVQMEETPDGLLLRPVAGVEPVKRWAAPDAPP